MEFIAEEIILMKSGRVIQFGKPQDITAEIDGFVWECGVPTTQAERYAASWNVSNLRNEENGTTVLRVIGERPPVAGAVQVQPNLEDLFLYYFGGNEG